MTAHVLEPLSYAGVDISQSADLIRAHFDSVGPNLLPPQYDQRLARVAGGWPRALAPQPLERTLELQVRLVIGDDGYADHEIQEFKRIFSPRKGEQTLVATDGTNDWELQASVLRMAHQNGVLNYWIVTLQAADGLWRKTTDTIQPTVISGATTAAIDATTLGNERSPAILEVTPSSIKGQANDQRYRSQQTVAWRAARGAARYLIALTLDTATEVTAGRMLGTGDDLRVLVDGRDVDRWLGAMNTGATKVWVVQDFSPARSGALKAAITAGAPATGGNLELEDAGDVPSAGTAVWGTEAISWLMKSSDGKTLLGIRRSVRGTTAASHAAGAVGYLVTRQVDLIWGHSGAIAPVRDPDTEPIFDLDDSDNGAWTFDNFATAEGKRPAEWVPMRLGTNTRLVTVRGQYDTNTYVPLAGGSLATGWAPTGAASLYQAVDDPVGVPDDDTSYISVATNTQRATFLSQSGGVLAGLPDNALIGSVTVHFRAKHSATGGSAIKALAYMAGQAIPTAVGTQEALFAAYTNFSFTWAANPWSGLPWTRHDLNSVEFGVESAGIGSGGIPRVTQVYLEVAYAPHDDTAGALGIYADSGIYQPGFGNRDAWALETPCGVLGENGALASLTVGPQSSSGLRLYGTDPFGEFQQIGRMQGGIALTTYPVTARPDVPLSNVVFHFVNAATTQWLGAAMTDIALTFDPGATPLVVAAAREDVYVARFTLENETTEQAIEVLYPMALDSTLTIDADAGTVTYSLPSYNPLPAVSFDAPRIPWLELEAGENDLVFSDPSHGSAGLGLSIRWKDRRS